VTPEVTAPPARWQNQRSLSQASPQGKAAAPGPANQVPPPNAATPEIPLNPSPGAARQR